MEKVKNILSTYKDARFYLLATGISTVITFTFLYFQFSIIFKQLTEIPLTAFLPFLSFFVGGFSASFGVTYGFYIGITIAILTLGLYFACFAFYKKRRGWIITSIVLYSLDAFLLLSLTFFRNDALTIINYALRFWVLYRLIGSLSYESKCKKLPLVCNPQKEEV